MSRTASQPISLPGRVVIFDYGEVISVEPAPGNRAELLAIAGVEPGDAEAFWQAYWRDRESLDAATVTIHDYWHAVGGELGRDWDTARTHQLWLKDLTGWMSIHPATMAVIEDLAAGGTRLALLSNAGPDYSSFFRNGSFGALFEQHFVSGELGLVKPDAAIYRHVLNALRVAPEQVVFIDNKAENIEAAERLGILGHVFCDADELRAFLMSLS